MGEQTQPIGAVDTLDVAAGFLRDAAGNPSSETSTATSEVTLADTTAPVISEINVSGAFTSAQSISRSSGDAFITGDTLTYTATLNDANDLLSASNMQVTLTLSNNKVLVLTRPDAATGSSKAFSADYIIEAGDTDASNLTVKSYSISNVSDVSGNISTNDKALGEITLSYSGVATDKAIQVDANAPTAKLLGTSDAPHTYDTSTGIMVLQGQGLGTIVTTGAVSRDVTNTVDWSKLTWNVDGLGSTTSALAQTDVTSAIVNDAGTSITVTLNTDGKNKLAALDGFGGTNATGGAVDTLDVAAGFLRDAAGNPSSETSTATSEVTLADTTAPVISEINVSGAFTSAQSISRSSGDAFITGDTLTYTATLNDANDLLSASNMQVTLTLSNNKVLVLTRPDAATGSSKAFSADYIIEAGDTDASNLTVKSYSISNVSDVSGNISTNDKALGEITLSYSGVATDKAIQVDANAPTAKLLGTSDAPHTYDTSTGIMVLQGQGLGTIVTTGAVSRDVTNTVDWSKLTWNVDGLGSTTSALAQTDVTSAIVNDAGTSITVTLNTDGKNKLAALDGFGGTNATGGAVDTLDVAAGFLRDAAGNLSSETSTSSSVLSLKDITSPVLSSIQFSTTPSSYVTIGEKLSFEAIFTDALASDGQLADDAELILTLNNNVEVKLTKSTNVDKGLHLVGDYTIAATDPIQDTLDNDGYVFLSIDNIDLTSVSDLSGNASNTNITSVNKTLSPVIIDTQAPSLNVVYKSGSDELVFVFDEVLDKTSADNLISAIGSLQNVDGSSSSAQGASNTTISFGTSQSDQYSASETISIDFSFADVAGNSSGDLSEFLIGSVI